MVITDLEKLGEYLKKNFPPNSLAIISHTYSFWGPRQLEIHYDPSDSKDRFEIIATLRDYKIEYSRDNKDVAKFEVVRDNATDDDFKLISIFINPLIVTKK